jgi:sarcosine oxidase subunit beta
VTGPSAGSDVVVVGAGVLGASVAARLSCSGRSVTLVERASPGHRGSSSGGATRILRLSHGPDAHLTEMAWRARRLWSEIRSPEGRPVLIEGGVLTFLGAKDRRWAGDTLRLHQRLGLRSCLLRPSEAQSLLPAADLSDLWAVLHEPDGGTLLASDALRALVDHAVANGATLASGDARWCDGQIRLGDRTLPSRHVVLATGRRLVDLLPAGLGAKVVFLDVVEVEGPEGSEPGWTAATVPAWVDRVDWVYGTGLGDGHGLKVVPDIPRRSPRTDRRRDLRRTARFLRRRFPSLAGNRMHISSTCHYVTTRTAAFVTDRSPTARNVWLLGGDNGQAFKHAPEIARVMAEAIEDDRRPPAQFRLSTPVQQRRR